jgi:hypothetical protein
MKTEPCVAVMSAISTWEQTQINNARATLQATADVGPAADDG